MNHHPILTRLKNITYLSFVFIYGMCHYSHAGIPPISNEGKIISLAPMLELVTPAVVNVSVSTASPLSKNPLFNDPFFRQFFGELDGMEGFGMRERERKQSAGSGVIIDAQKGIIVTNHHVISQAQKITVTLKNKKTYTATLIGVDPATDLAIISIPAQGNSLSAIRLGNSDKVEVGDFVAAIGNPFAIGQTVTSGIVSALGRSGLNIKHFEDFIQTDAAINPGNSGGALVNLQGELIGINTSIISPAGVSVGIGFAIPVNMVKTVADQILKNGRVERGVFGVEIQDLTNDLANSLAIPLRDGALLSRVFPNTPADSAGLQAGDLIIELNGSPIRSANHLRSQFALLPPQSLMKMRLLREGKPLVINAKMGDISRPRSLKTPEQPQIKQPPPSNAQNTPESVGWELQEKNGKVIVSDLNPQGLAARWGVEEGDIILTFEGKIINSIADLPKKYSAQVDISLQRGGAVVRFIRR